MKSAGLRVAVLGATGLVGRRMVTLLEGRRLPIGELRLLASERTEGRSLSFRGQAVRIEPARSERLDDVDLVLSSAGASVSRALLPHAAAAGAVCVDNTSAFRMEPDVPLVVPEVNGHRLRGIRIGGGGAIIANPNCSTIQLVAALKPLHDAARVLRVVVSTYQSISGAGRAALERFRASSDAILSGERDLGESLRATAAFDAIPDIGGLDEEGCSGEERKMANETPKILEAPIELDVCCVRIPVFTGHAESVLVQTAEPLSVESAQALLSSAHGIALELDGAYPTPREVVGDPAVHVGRVRRSRTTTNGLLMWVVADNLLKGAALNAVQIAEQLIEPSHATAPGTFTSVSV